MFSNEQCDKILSEIKTIESSRWFRRTKINSLPTMGTTEADYYFLGYKQQTKEFNQLLNEMAPRFDDAQLVEVCINRYDVGQYMPEHRDITHHRYNVVVALNEENDGITVEGVFYPDVKGIATIFPYASKPHAVPPVKHQRYIIIYLYEKG